MALILAVRPTGGSKTLLLHKFSVSFSEEWLEEVHEFVCILSENLKIFYNENLTKLSIKRQSTFN